MTTIKRGNTAISRTKHSKPYQYLINNYFEKGDTILDYGCGRGYDVETLKKQGHFIYGYDKFHDKYNNYKTINENQVYDYVTCNYVFNVIENPAERQELLLELKRLGFTIFISLRADFKSIKNTWKTHNDGFITPKGTFQKFYTLAEAKREFFHMDGWNYEVITNNSNEIMFKIY